jgi:replicative DNA helicase
MPAPAAREMNAPQSLEAERALLGSILLDNGALNVAAGIVSRDDFFSGDHRVIFAKMEELSARNRTIDLVTLVEEITKDGLLEKFGGAANIASLTDGVPIGNYSSVEQYSRIVKEKSLLRRLINASNNTISRCFEGNDDPDVLLDLAQSEIFEIAGEKVESAFLGVQDIVDKSFGTIEALFHRGQRITGVETGFVELDNLTSGLQPGELIIIAARPSLGKTALALNVAAHAATQGKLVAVFSLEMSRESLVTRLLCSEARVDSHKLRTGFSSKEDWAKITQALGRLSQTQLFIEDSPALSVLQIRAKARRLKAEKKRLDLVIVDYLQLATGHGRFENRTQEVSYISRQLKGIAKELEIPVLALSQLSRAPEQHGSGPPQLWHLRESGSIEQDADVVIFIYRERRREDAQEEFNPSEGVETKLIVSKQRNGPTGEVKVVFQKPWVRFENALAAEPYE